MDGFPVQMITLLVVLLCVLALACCALGLLWVRAIFTHQRQLENIEAKWRQREWELFDRALIGQGVKPLLKIEREKTLTIPEPEKPNETWTEVAMHEDRIKEEIEQLYPEAARMPVSEVKALYGAEWRKYEQQFREHNTPLRSI